MASPGDNGESTGGRRWLVALALLSVIGLAVCVYLSILHWQVYNVPGHVSFCAISEGMNCDTVALSNYSAVLGVPVSSWGILFYVLMIVLLVWGLLGERGQFPWGLLAFSCAGALGASAFLFLVSHYIIGAICIMCLSLYIINLASALVCVLGQRKLGLPIGGPLNLVLLAALLGTAAFAAIEPGTLSNTLFTIGAGVLVAAVVALTAVGRLSTERRILARLADDLGVIFERRWLGVALGLLAAGLVAALLVVTPLMYPHQADEIAGGLEDIDHGLTPDGHEWIGAAKPDVVISEYSDYECPFCRRAHLTVRQVVRERKEWLRLVHVQVPLDDKCNPMIKRPFHRFACGCARAAICAARQDSFWPMNDALFLRRCGLDSGGLTVLASKLGLNARTFRECMQSPVSAKQLQDDISQCISVAQECRQMGRRFGTPTFTIGDRVVVGAKKKEFWLDLVDRQRAISRKSPSARPSP